MDMQKNLDLIAKMLADFEEEKKTNPNAVFDVSKLPIDIEVMKAFVNAHNEVSQKMAKAEKKTEE